MAELTLTRAELLEVLSNRNRPAITRWHRIDGIPRTHDLARALRAEIRDPLWLLARQWQVGEFRGDDAGSPIFAKLHLATTRLTGYRAKSSEEGPYDEASPLEATVERRPIPFGSQRQPLSLDVRLLLGRHLAKLLGKHGLASAERLEQFRRAFSIRRPDPELVADAPVAAHRDAFQHYAAFAERAIDGYEWYRWLLEHPTAPRNFAELPAPLSIDASDAGALDAVADAFLRWLGRLFEQPAHPEGDAWDGSRLEYRFGCSAPVGTGKQELVASEYRGGSLDWYAFDRGPTTPDPARTPEVQAVTTNTFLPTAVEFNGMANARYFALEDRRVNFSAVQPDTTDIAKLSLLDFGLVHANDWCLFPVPLPCGTLAEVRGLAVTNVFGERFWIEPAGTRTEESWQRFRLFALSSAEGAPTGKAQLLMLPTVPKIQSGPPLEEIHLLRDEMANLVWAVEKQVPLPHGEAKTGSSTAAETLACITRLLGGAPPPPPFENEAKVRYELMTSVPENWIPFVPAHVPGQSRQVQLQRASMPRLIPGRAPEKVKPRTSLMRTGLDQESPAPYLIHEEEVPRAGIQVRLHYQRTRWTDGRAVVWLGAEKQVGRGEGSSGLEFDRLVELKKPNEAP